MTEHEFDPYRKWLGIPPAEQPPNHYRLLGLAIFESDPDVISNAADRQMAHIRTFQGGKYSDLSQKILNELSAARVTLLNDEKRRAYDEQLRAKLQGSAQVVQVVGPSMQGGPAVGTQQRQKVHRCRSRTGDWPHPSDQSAHGRQRLPAGR